MGRFVENVALSPSTHLGLKRTTLQYKIKKYGLE